MTNVSSAKGKRGQKKPAQRYKNTFAFKPLSHNPALQAIAALPARGLCKRCLDIVEWRKRMNKYKPLTQRKTCSSCHERTITDAYHVICQSCASKERRCAKCLEIPDTGLHSARLSKTAAEELKDSQELERKISLLNERSRRSYLRRVERGDEEGANSILSAKLGSDDEFSCDDDFSDDEDDLSSEGNDEDDASEQDE